jgi:hypothetical protein
VGIGVSANALASEGPTPSGTTSSRTTWNGRRQMAASSPKRSPAAGFSLAGSGCQR